MSGGWGVEKGLGPAIFASCTPSSHNLWPVPKCMTASMRNGTLFLQNADFPGVWWIIQKVMRWGSLGVDWTVISILNIWINIHNIVFLYYLTRFKNWGREVPKLTAGSPSQGVSQLNREVPSPQECHQVNKKVPRSTAKSLHQQIGLYLPSTVIGLETILTRHVDLISM